MTQHEMILIENFSRGLLPGTTAAIYSSCQNLRKRLSKTGEKLSFDEAFLIWRGYVGEPILNMLATDEKIYKILGSDRFKVFFIALEKIEQNDFKFLPEIVCEVCAEYNKKTVA